MLWQWGQSIFSFFQSIHLVFVNEQKAHGSLKVLMESLVAGALLRHVLLTEHRQWREMITECNELDKFSVNRMTLIRFVAIHLSIQCDLSASWITSICVSTFSFQQWWCDSLRAVSSANTIRIWRKSTASAQSSTTKWSFSKYSMRPDNWTLANFAMDLNSLDFQWIYIFSRFCRKATVWTWRRIFDGRTHLSWCIRSPINAVLMNAIG